MPPKTACANPPALQDPADTALLRLATALRDEGYTFVTPTPATHARVNARPCNEWAHTLQDVFGWSRPFRGDTVPSGLLALMREAGVLAGDGEAWRSLVRLSCLDRMLFLHSAYPTTAADSVFLGPDTYRFAAALDEWLARAAAPVRRAVDIGCGAGPGAMVLAARRPDAEVLGVDINPAALRLTRINAALAGVAVTASHSDLLGGVTGTFDLIISNPPYLVDREARAYRHGGGPLGAGLSLAILDAALARLAPGGTLLLYTGAAIVNGIDPFRAAATERVEAAGVKWAYREMDPDVFGEELAEEPYAIADRIAAVVLTATKSRETSHA
jgi:methylase of polypeptide subunit release factors